MDNINVTADVIANVNRLLAEGKSLNQLDKTDALLKLSRKAFRNRAMKENYFFNQDKRQFELKNKDIDITSNNTTLTLDNIQKTQNNTDKMIKDLLQRIKKIESIVFNSNTHISNFKLDNRVNDNIEITFGSKKIIGVVTSIDNKDFFKNNMFASIDE